jgi:hypothetical protein
MNLADSRVRSVMAPSTQETAEKLARSAVLQVAPEEEEIFDVVTAAHRRNPQRPAPGGDEMLGFGVDDAMTLLTPVVLGAAAEVVRYLAVEAAGALEVRSRLRRIFRRRDARRAAPETLALDPARRAAVRNIVLEKCRQAGVEPGRAELVADAVLGALGSTD